MYILVSAQSHISMKRPITYMYVYTCTYSYIHVHVQIMRITTVEPLYKDTPEIRTSLYSGTFFWPNSVQIRGVPLYVQLSSVMMQISTNVKEITVTM